MALKDQLAGDMATFFNTDDFAVEILYKSAAVKAFIDYFQDPNFSGSNKCQKAQIVVKRSDVAEPANQDLVYFDGVSWLVDTVESGSDLTWTITVRRKESVAI